MPFTVAFLGEGSPTKINYRKNWVPTSSNLKLSGGPSRCTLPQANMEAPEQTPLKDLVPFTEAFWELPC